MNLNSLNELGKPIYFEEDKLLLNKEYFNIHHRIHSTKASHPENLGKFYSNNLISLSGQPRVRGSEILKRDMDLANSKSN